MKLLLDTNAYSALMAGDSNARNLVSLAERLYMPMPVIGELLYGFLRGNRHAENLRHLQKLLAREVVSLAGIDFDVCEVYARIGNDLRRNGTPIPANDHWIAAIALRNGFVLMTADRHFQQIGGLDVRSWKH